MGKKNIASAKVKKQKPMTEQEKKEFKEQDVKEFIETQIAIYDSAEEHLDRPAKFLEVLTSARMFAGKDDIDYHIAFDGLKAIEEAYKDIRKATKKITVKMIEEKGDPYVELLLSIYTHKNREPKNIKDALAQVYEEPGKRLPIERIFENYLYNMQVLQAGQLYLEHFFKVESASN